MDVDEILAKLDRNEGHFPQMALEEAVAHRNEIIPRLLGVLEEVARNPQPFAAGPDRMIQTYAMYLLAQFREYRAYPLLVEIFSAPGRLPFDLVGEVVTQDLGRILASVSDGDLGGIKSLVENPEANDFVRTAAMDAMVTLVVCGRLTREEVMAYFRSLFYKLERTPTYVWSGLANACADLGPEEVMAELRQAYEDELIDPTSINWEDVEEALEIGPNEALEGLRGHRTLITNTIDDMRWWACFDANSNEHEREDNAEVLEDDAEVWEDDLALPPLFDPEPDFPEPYIRTEPKIGRNEPCPCGSGKKYKKCCGLLNFSDE